MALALCAVLVPPTCAKSIRITDFNLSVFSHDSISVSLSDKAPLLSYFVIIPHARMRSELRVRYCSRSVGLWVSLYPRFLSNRGCCRYQTWIFGYVQRALGTARVWNVVVKEQRVYGERLKFTLMCTLLVKAESGGYQTWICG